MKFLLAVAIAALGATAVAVPESAIDSAAISARDADVTCKPLCKNAVLISGIPCNMNKCNQQAPCHRYACAGGIRVSIKFCPMI